LWTTVVEGGGNWGAPSTQWCAGRTGRRSKPPAQFGHTFDRTVSTHSRQNVHSIVQIIASGASRGSGRLQFSHVGRSSSIVESWHRAAAQKRLQEMGARGFDPASCAIEQAKVGWRETS
jgi:hypothetical protein